MVATAAAAGSMATGHSLDRCEQGFRPLFIAFGRGTSYTMLARAGWFGWKSFACLAKTRKQKRRKKEKRIWQF